MTLPPSRFARHRELPALALPRGREDRRAGAVLSLLVHVLVIVLLVTPFAVHHAIVEMEQGAGGPGPAGGGGGGHGGTGGAQETERLQFIRVAAPLAATPAPMPAPLIVPPTPVPPPEPIKVEATPKIEPKLELALPAKLPEVAATPGVGGGSGRDGTNGSGPGSGGGVGSGIGTGRGTGIGPGTGGGTQANYPPTAIELFIPPMPVPDNVRGAHIIAEFDVDSTGRVLGLDFTRTKDRDYNKRLEEAFRGFRFRPGTRPDGTPLRMKAQVGIDLP
jgi:protein TonB